MDFERPLLYILHQLVYFFILMFHYDFANYLVILETLRVHSLLNPSYERSSFLFINIHFEIVDHTIVNGAVA